MLLACSLGENKELVILIMRYERILTLQNQVRQSLNSFQLTFSPKSSIHELLTFISNNTIHQKLSCQ